MSWVVVEYNVLQRPCHQDVKVERYEVQHPSTTVGFYKSTGAPQGQIADYRKPLNNDRGLHVREFVDRYLVHWDNFDPSTNLIGHFIVDAPFYGLLALLGIVVIAAYFDS